jgi:hypothetical protein
MSLATGRLEISSSGKPEARSQLDAKTASAESKRRKEQMSTL